MKNILGILVTYNPDILTLQENVKIISKEVDFLVIVDNNSINKHELQILLELSNNVEIIYSEYNNGLGKAYNTPLAKYSNQFQSFVTFDQDTKILHGSLEVLYNNLFSEKSIGVVGPSFSRGEESIKEGKLIDKTVIIQSCAIFKMDVYNKIKGFNEDYFIDSVDFEYCLRMKVAGFLVKIYDGINIYHELGEEKDFNGKKLTVHSNIRNYYMARNHFRLLKSYGLRFPFFSLKLHFFFLKHLYEVKFIEKNNNKMKYIIQGLLNKNYEKI